MPFIELRGWTSKTAKRYVTVRSPVFNELPLSVHSVNEGTLGSDIYIDRVLEQYLLIYTVDGTGIVEYENRKLVMEKNTICIFGINDHIIYYPVNKWNSKWIFIEGKACLDLHNVCYHGNVTPTEMNNPEMVNGIFDSMIKNIHTPSILCDVTCSSLIYQLWTKIIQYRQNQYIKPKNSACIQECIEYMRNNLDEKINVNTLAIMCFFSKAQFSRVFKKHTGYSPYDYLIQLRINKVKQLLTETDLSLDEISFSTGFNGASHLISYFKKYENITPYKYKSMFFQ